jgi:hypothetical protein
MSDKDALEKSLEEVIEQASKLHIQRELTLQFEQNIKLFKSFAPEIAKKYKNYKPQRFQLGIDDSMSINIYDIRNGKPVYEDEAEDFCQRQVVAYFKNPLVLAFFLKSYPKVDYFFSSTYLNEILNQYSKELKSYKGSSEQPITLMMISGIGLGYHLIELIETKQIYHMCLLENEPDFLFASLHTIDWTKIYRYFNQPYRSLELYFEKDIRESINGTKSMVLREGLTCLTNAYFYNHLGGDYYNNLLDTFRLQISYLSMGYGSIEDETISIAHTLLNIKEDYPVLTRSNTKESTPCFIVANGPSLDKLIELIKSNQEKAIIISCGSTLSVLYNENIVPDIHIEMERTYATTYSLIKSCDENYLKNIKLIAFNNVPPSTFKLFKESYIVLKNYDSGLYLLKQMNRNIDYKTLKFSNPTVANLALTVAMELGFTDIYLLGMDMGSKTNQHHASNSLYDKEVFNDDFKMPIKTEGNYGGIVKTKPELVYANLNLSNCLESHSDRKIYNLSDGARINLTIPMKLDKVNLSPLQQNKNQIISNIFSNCFSQLTIKIPSNECIIEEYLSSTANYLELLSLSLTKATPKTAEDVLLIFQQVTQNLKNLENQQEELVTVLCDAIIQTFFSLIFRVILASDPSDLEKSYIESITFLCKYFDQSRKHIIENSFIEQLELT